MAFKMTPGIKGNPAQERVQALGACGGDGQPPCEPLFEKEKQERKVQRFKKAKIKKPAAPVKESPVKETPVKEGPISVPGAVPIAVPVEGGVGEGVIKKPGKGKK